MLKQVSEHLYTLHDQTFKFLIFSLGTRMTVIKLKNGGLWIHSPLHLSDELKDELNKLGPVKYIIAPNYYHHLFAGYYKEAWPEAGIYGPKSLAGKRKDLEFAGFLDEMEQAPWDTDLEHKWFTGSENLAETVFFHPESKTMITCDLLFNIHQIENWWTGLYLKFMNCYKQVGLSKVIKLVVRDKKAARAGIDSLLEWDFQRVSMAHGELVEENAKQQFKDAWSWC